MQAMLSLTAAVREEWKRAEAASLDGDGYRPEDNAGPFAAPVADGDPSDATQSKKCKQGDSDRDVRTQTVFAATETKPKRRCKGLAGRLVAPKQVCKDPGPGPGPEFVKIVGLRHYPLYPDDTQRLLFIHRAWSSLTRRLPQPGDCDKAEAIAQDTEKFFLGTRHPALYFDDASLVDAVLAKRALILAEHWLQNILVIADKEICSVMFYFYVHTHIYIIFAFIY